MAVGEIAQELAVPETKARSPWMDAFYQLLRNKAAVVSGVFITLLILMAILADFVAPYPPNEQVLASNFAKPLSSAEKLDKKIADKVERGVLPGRFALIPSGIYISGADFLGRDILSRTLYGARISLAVSVVAATVSLVIGVVYGLVSGYFGGRVDDLMMRFVDFLYGFPFVVSVILMQVYFKAMGRHGATGIAGVLIKADRAMGGVLFLFIAMGLLNWIGMARIARGQVLSYKQMEFTVAARALGAGHSRIIFRHLLPNILGPCIVQETLAIPGYIRLEAFLSFIGLGITAPTPSWGIMIQEGYQALRANLHVILTPSLALTLTVLTFNFLGDGFRDALDPTMRGT